MQPNAGRSCSSQASAPGVFNATSDGTSAEQSNLKGARFPGARTILLADFNTGVSAYAAPNRGLFEQTGKTGDMGKFQAPSLRNVAVTAPYMHDGSLATLDEVIQHYAAGGRLDHPNKSHILRPL